MYSNTQSEYDDKKIGEMKICINIKKSHQMRNFRLNIKKLFMLALFAVHIQNKFLSLGCEKKKLIAEINTKLQKETFSMQN